MYYSDPLIKYAIHKYKGEGGQEAQEELCLRLKSFDKKALIRFYILASGANFEDNEIDKPTIENLINDYQCIFERHPFPATCHRSESTPPKKSEVINLIVENYVIKDISWVRDCDGW